MQYHDPKAGVSIDTTKSIDAQFDYKVLEQQKREREQQEKNDPYAKFNDPEFLKKLDETNKKVDKEYDPEKLAKENEERERVRREKERLNDPLRARDERTKRLSDMIKNLAGSKLDAQRKVALVPQNTVLLDQLGTKFKESVSASRRAKKIKNKKSRLFAKDKNYNRIFDVSNEYTKRKFLLMSDSMKGRSIGCDQETLRDLSAFMDNISFVGEDQVDHNKKLLDDYLGVSKDPESGEVQGQNRNAALEAVIKKFFTLDVHDINFENDTEMVKSAYKLEMITNCVGALDRLIKKNPQFFMQDISTQLKNKIYARLDELRAVAAYYVSRKELLSDETFRTHYDDELSMEVKEASSDEQRAVAEKLMRSYVLGKNLVRLNSNGQLNMNNVVNVEMHFRNEKSTRLFQRALELENKDEQKNYLEKAYASMDYLACGVRLNAGNLNLKELPQQLNGNNLIGESSDRFNFFIGRNNAFENEIKRKDLDEIKNKLRAKGIDISMDNSSKLRNPLTGEVIEGLGVDRMLEALPARATFSYGTDDIVTMFFNLFAPAMEENRNLEEGPQKQKLVANFKDAFSTYKTIQLGTLRSYMNTFGNIPQQLAVEDNKRLLYTYGDIVKEFTVLMQDMNLFFGMDKTGELFNLSENFKDSELLYRNSYVFNNGAGFTPFQAQNDLLLENDQLPEDMAAFNLRTSMEELNDPIYLSENFEKNRFVNGPSMSKAQLKKYSDQVKKTLAPSEFDFYTERRKLCTDTTKQVLSYWTEAKVTWFTSRVGVGTVIEQKDLKRKALLQLRTLDPLKKSPIWNNPDLVKDKTTRKGVILAKENENYVKNIVRAIDHAVDYLTLKERLKKENNLDDQGADELPEVIKAKAKMNEVKNNLRYINNVYVVYARENALKEVAIEQDVSYTPAAYEAALRDFKNLSYKDVKFGKWGDIIKNYHHNMALCRRAERFQNLLGEAILSGKTFKEKFLKETRAKLRFFNEIKRTCVYVNSEACRNPAFCDKTAEEIRQEATGNLNRGNNDYRRKAFPTTDLKALYNSYVRDVNEEDDDKEDLIVKGYYGISPEQYTSYDQYYGKYYGNIDDPNVATISDEEVDKRKKQYQKNAMLADYFARLNESFNQTLEENDAAINAYCQRNGLTRIDYSRTEGNMMGYLSPSKAIEIYKLFTGSNEDKMKLYMMELKEIEKLKYADYQMSNLKELFKGTTIKQKIKTAQLGTCAEGIGKDMKKIIEDKNDPQKAGRTDLVKLPEGFVDLDDLLSRTLFTQNMYYNYVGRFTAILQMTESKYRGVMSVEDMKRIDPYLAQKRRDMDPVYSSNPDDPNLIDNLKKVQNLIPTLAYEQQPSEEQMEAGAKGKYARFDTDMDMIFAHEFKRHFGNQNRPQQGAQGNNAN